MLLQVHSVGFGNRAGRHSAHGRMTGRYRAGEEVVEQSASEKRLKRGYLTLMSRELRVVIVADVYLLALPVLYHRNPDRCRPHAA
jgi:hypothetical protein